MLIRRLLSSTGFRLSVIYAALLLVSFLLAAGGAWFATRNSALNEAGHRLETVHRSFSAIIERKGVDAAAHTIERRLAHDTIVWRLTDPTGANVGGDAAIPNHFIGLGVFELLEADPNEPTGDYAVLTRMLPNGSRLSVADNIERTEHIRNAVLSSLFGVGTLAVLLALAAGVWATRRTLARMDALSNAARAFGAGDLRTRAPERVTGNPDDIDELVGSFNHMFDRVDSLIANIRRVSADVAHDLRTPLTHLRQRLEGARQASTPEAYVAAVEAAQSSVDDILRSFDAMLRLSEIEAGAMRARFANLDLAVVMERVCDAYRPDIEASGRSLTVSLAAGSLINGDADLLAQAAANLLENAIRHTPAAADITLQIVCSDDRVKLVVGDNGVGVPAEYRELVLQPFKRLDESRGQPGSGLGLSIVSAIARLHEAKLLLEDNAPGLRATIAFPASRRLDG